MRLSLAEVFETATFYAHFDVVRDGDPAVPPITIRVCDSIACAMAGAETLFAALRATAGQAIRVLRAPCIGLCDQAPAVAVGHAPLGHATPEEALAAVRAVEIQARLPSYVDHDAYHAGGGYALLKRLRLGEFSSDAVIDALDKAALRGLGGAGFPTGRKWRTVRSERGPRLMVVNGDEGEPGTFKDRFYLESDPHRFLEGMLIGAHVVEATDVYLYIRDEYPAAREILAREIAKLPEGGPTLHLRRGAGAYICGEESALIESIEGKRGLPRHKPPFIYQAALRRPTLVNNVETLFWCATSSSVVPIGGRDKGAMAARASVPSRFRAAYGTRREARAGGHHGSRADRGILRRHGAGPPACGLPAGRCIRRHPPASLADVPLDFGTLEQHGCFIGSAAVVVLSDQDDLKAAARGLMRFFEDESCGQCTPCRVGTQKARMLMERPEWDLPLLEELAAVMRDASICGWGRPRRTR